MLTAIVLVCLGVGRLESDGVSHQSVGKKGIVYLFPPLVVSGMY
jgi:hypothetical protein